MKATKREGARAIGKRAVFTQISEAAREMFERDGFERTSVDAISEAAGISTRTFYRYYPSKEEVVLSWLDEVGLVLRARVTNAPDNEDIWTSLRRALDSVSQLSPQQVSEYMLAEALWVESKSLYAGLLERLIVWERQLAEVVQSRLQGQDITGRHARMCAAFAMAGLRVCYELAMDTGHENLGKYLDEYFAGIRPG
ncbi:TetR family transcriptional regulator [Rhodococcoides fascians]|uniref:TetR family transcriptional regulator n=1 Tax=Rhodococcoides fascians TaxID=1828 RepID=UPI00068FD8B4|nr:TetR family transcriptional regulator [Rhodococcus fascians]